MHPWNSGRHSSAFPRVLIAEDDTVTRLILKHWILRWGYEVVVVETGLDAWKVLEEEQPPEVVIVDWSMPGMDGIELCRRLRDRSRSYYHYILMVTSRTDELDLVHALEAGADDCLVKPFGEPELRARLLVANRILALQNELIHAREEIRAQAMRDGLTGIWNRAAFLDLFNRELERARRINGSTGLLLIDLDNFKRVNDTFGHLAGDCVLKEAAARLSQNVRSYDFVGRFGGEEFVIAMPGSGREQLRQRSEALRNAICSSPIQTPQGDIPVSISIGIAVAESGKQSVSSLLALADVGLYRAKSAGRNRSVVCDKPSTVFLDCTLTHDELCAQCISREQNLCVVKTMS